MVLQLFNCSFTTYYITIKNLSQMTNAEINLEVAVKLLNENKLTGSAKSFIEDIKDYDKKDLRRLTKKQYQFLNSIYKQYS